MTSLVMKMHRGERGFTLIELLIVVAIAGIIAAVVIPNVSTFHTTGTVAAANDEASSVKTAAIAYYAREESWPETSDDLTATGLLAGDLSARYDFRPGGDAAKDGFIHDADPAIEDGWGESITWDESKQLWIRTP